MNQCWMAFEWRSWVGIQAGWKPALQGLLLLASLAPGAAWGHGPQIQITNTQGKIVTHDLFTDGPYTSPTPARSVYVMPVLPDLGIWYSRPNTAERPIVGGPQSYSGPGLAFGLQAGTPEAFASGENFSLHFTDSLLHWDGIEFTDPGAEQLRAFRGSPTDMSAMATTSDTSPFQSLTFPTISSDYEGDVHSSARFQFLGDGLNPTVEPQDGVYLLSLSLSSTQPDIDDSDEFFFILHKNASRAQIASAVASLGFAPTAVQYLGTVVPEPSSLAIGLLAVGAVAILSCRRG